MRTRKISMPIALAILAFAGLSGAAPAPFVDSNGALPGAKTDRFPPTNVGQQWTASDANIVRGALADLRTVAQRAPLSVKAFGALCDGVNDDAAAIQAALNAAGTSSGSTYGGIVDVPALTANRACMVGSQLLLPNGVRLRGAGPSASIIRAKSTFNAASLIRNSAQDGTQEFGFLESIQFDGNQGAGAVCSTAVVDLVSLFVNSYVRDVLVTNGSNVGLHVGAANAMGPVLIENTWVVNNLGHNVLIEELAGNAQAVTGVVAINLTSEHQGSNKSALYLKGLGHSSQWTFYNTHIEQGGSATGRTAITIDGVSDVLFHGVELLATLATVTDGIRITNVAQNARIQIQGVYNPNLITPVINDLLDSVTVGAIPVPWFVTPDVTVRGSMRFTPHTTTGAKSLVAQNSSGTDIAWFDDAGRLTGGSPTSAGLDIASNTTDGSGGGTGGRVLALINLARTRAFGFNYPDSSFIRFRGISAGVDIWDADNSGNMRVWNKLTALSTIALQGKVSTGGGNIPVLSSCGTSPSITSGSTMFAGKFTTGTIATGCTVTFAQAFTNVPTCNVTAPGVAVPTYNESTTAITMTLDVASTTYRYTCVGLNE